MKLSTLVFVLGVFRTTTGHSVFTNLIVDEIDQGDGVCVRMPMDPHSATDPINDLASDDMACGFGGTKGVARVCPIKQGSTLGFQFREFPDGSKTGTIDSSHKGPCAVYMKHVDSAIKDSGVGDGWFKIASAGYDKASSKWCTEQLSLNNGAMSFKVPEDLAGGYYLVRPELLTLQDADKSPPNPQFYTGCAQIFLDSKATCAPNDTVSIPGYVSISSPSVLFDIYNPKWPYPELGPNAYVARSSASRQVQPLDKQTEGLLPENAITTNANWWGIELDKYHTEDGCWNASKSCYAQADTCYKSAPPTGSKNCKLWEGKCHKIQLDCDKGVFVGPPNDSQAPGTNTTGPDDPLGTSSSSATVQVTLSSMTSIYASASVSTNSGLSSAGSALGTSVAASSSVSSAGLSISSSARSSATTTTSNVQATVFTNTINLGNGQTIVATFSLTLSSTVSSTSVSSSASTHFVVSPSTTSSSVAAGSTSSSSGPSGGSTMSSSVFPSSFAMLSATASSSTPGLNLGYDLPTSPSSTPHASSTPVPLTSTGPEAVSIMSTQLASSKSKQDATTTISLSSSLSTAVLSSTSALPPLSPSVPNYTNTTTSSLEIILAESISSHAPTAQLMLSATASPTLSLSSSYGPSAQLMLSETSILSSSLASSIVSVFSPSPSVSSTTTSTSTDPNPMSSAQAVVTSKPSTSTNASSSPGAASTPTSIASATPTNAGNKISPDGTCGEGNNYTCAGRAAGACCSAHGFCGGNKDHCEIGKCQEKWGLCGEEGMRSEAVVSRNGRKLLRWERRGVY